MFFSRKNPRLISKPNDMFCLNYQINAMLSFFLCVMLSLLHSLQSANGETIQEALLKAYNNPKILAERARQRSDTELEIQARSGFLPNISLDAGITRHQTRLNDPTSNIDLDQKDINLTLTQPLYRGFRSLNELKRAKAQVRAGNNKLLDTEQSLLLSAATSYINVLKARKILRLRKDNIRFLKKELRVIRDRFKEGELTKTDIEQAKARLYQGTENKEAARASLSDAIADYIFFIGNHPRKLTYPKRIGSFRNFSLVEAIRIAKSENPKIIKAKNEKEVAEYNLKIAYGELMPTVDFEASYEREYQPSSLNGRSDTGEVGVRLKFPLYTGGITRSKIRQAEALKKQAAYSYMDMRNQVGRSVQSLWHRRHANLDRIRANRKNVKAIRETVRGLQYELKSGERSIIDLLNAQRELTNARIGYVNSKYDLLTKNFELTALFGRFGIQTVRRAQIGETRDYGRGFKKLGSKYHQGLIRPYVRRK